MSERPKILLLDDEEDLLDLYREVLMQLPSQPDVRTASSGARAIALLEAEAFTMIISDLNMPRMDGLQVLSIVRRRFPQLRFVVMTSVLDEQYRSRAYAMGVDLFWEKPGTAQEIKLFQECIESLLGTEPQNSGGFRGVQSKSLVDLIQLECLSQSSSVLKITNGGVEGRIWVNSGEITDSSVGEMSGESAFKEIFSWKGGSFEILPPDSARIRTIFNSYQGLLLDTAQSIDESHGARAAATAAANAITDADVRSAAVGASHLADLSKVDGVEFLQLVAAEGKEARESWGVENPDQLADWSREMHRLFDHVGEKLNVGEVVQIEGFGLQRHVALARRGDAILCAGFRRTFSQEQVRESMKTVLIKWAF